jgi:thymidine kinase
MIQIIAGLKGSGKTKRLIDMTNATATEGNNDVIFLDDDNRYMFDIDHKVRFINAGEYHVHTPEMFVGFISGMLSQNFDVGTIFIDAFKKLCKTDLNDAAWLFQAMEELSAKHNVNFVLSVSADPETMPDFVKKYLI